MKLSYKILWFDDQPHNVDAAKEYLKQELANFGFKLEIVWASRENEYQERIESLSNYHDFDLIMIDWDLGKGTSENSLTGDTLAKKVRKNTYTEIIFYSAKPAKELRQLIFEQNIDGVYSVNRKNLGEESKNIVNITIKKILDINNMRGIIISSVGDFDHIIGDCLEVNYSLSAEKERNRQILSIKTRVKNSLEQALKKIDSIDDFDSLVSSYSFSTSLRYNELQSQLNSMKDDELNECINMLKEFKGEIIDMRNTLAHARVIEEDGKHKFESKPENIVISDEYFTKARIDVLKHETNLIKIKKALSGGDYD